MLVLSLVTPTSGRERERKKERQTGRQGHASTINHTATAQQLQHTTYTTVHDRERERQDLQAKLSAAQHNFRVHFLKYTLTVHYYLLFIRSKDDNPTQLEQSQYLFNVIKNKNKIIIFTSGTIKSYLNI